MVIQNKTRLCCEYKDIYVPQTFISDNRKKMWRKNKLYKGKLHEQTQNTASQQGDTNMCI